jgi:acyl dehydratase
MIIGTSRGAFADWRGGSRKRKASSVLYTIDMGQREDYMGIGAAYDKMRYFEDYAVGAVYEFGSVLVEEGEIIDFARRYDPQVFHIDPEAAKKTAFGGLVASGWHTVAMATRLIVDQELSHTASLGSPGVDELRWWKPVRPGHVLSVRITVTEARRSQSRPDRGVVQGLIEVLNQTGEIVASWKGTQFVLLQESGPGRRLGRTGDAVKDTKES